MTGEGLGDLVLCIAIW